MANPPTAPASKIAEFQAAHPDLAIRVVENPRRNIPAALNAPSALPVASTSFAWMAIPSRPQIMWSAVWQT